MDPFIHWVRSTPASNWVNSTVWIWPLCETLHFIGLSLVIGCVGFFDLRLMGFFRRVPISAARELMPFAIAGVLLNLSTGLVFLIGLPEQYAHNVAWWTKVGFLVLAGLNALFYETTLAPRMAALTEGADTPTAAKLIGALSLFSWFGVLYWGRMLPFIGNAF
jgi:hypothetical protein